MQRLPESSLALRVTSTAAAIFAFALAVWGAVVRVNGAGMTCPDWPKCRGAWLPSLNDPVVYEFSHRVGAPLLTLLIAATFVLAFRNRRALPETMRLAWAALALVFVQIVVGALTIRYANNPPSVASHLVVGIATFTTLALLAYSAFAGRGAPVARKPSGSVAMLAQVGWLSALLAFATIFAGGFMSASHAGLACAQFPLCNGWQPAHGALQQLHMDHRIAAYATAIVTAMFALLGLQRRSAAPEIRTLLWLALALVAAQVTLGALTVISGLAPVLRIVHEGNGALLAAALTLIAYRIPRAAPQEAALGEPETSVIGDYIALTKPNVMSLLLFTTLTAMMIAAGGLPSLSLITWTLLGGALASASSGAINMYWDRDIDAQMTRTRRRPIPSGRIAPRRALVFGILLGVAAFVELALTVNYLAAALSTVGILYYVFVYTMWLKRTTPQNIVV
ncbi:MAG: COX15/CtaA family protein, partial [Candidatus Eremiobacteraeota bacterium]|nr:COX15/CtaA family protein [Candidatus Eremiobacteraeota bacterium]